MSYDEYTGPIIAVVPDHAVKLDLSDHEHEVLVNVLKRESYHPTVKVLLRKVMENARRKENAPVPDRGTA